MMPKVPHVSDATFTVPLAAAAAVVIFITGCQAHSGNPRPARHKPERCTLQNLWAYHANRNEGKRLSIHATRHFPLTQGRLNKPRQRKCKALNSGAAAAITGFSRFNFVMGSFRNVNVMSAPLVEQHSPSPNTPSPAALYFIVSLPWKLH